MTQTMQRTLRTAAFLAAVAVLAAPAFAAGTPVGTPITNQASVSYEDANGNTLTALSNIVTTTVSQLATVVVDPDNSATADPGDVVVYAHTVTNSGNGDDTINLTASSSQGWTTVVFVDVNANGQYDAGTDTVVADTGLLPADGTFDVWVAVTVPAGTLDGTVDVTTVTGTSVFDGTVSDTALDTTTISSPTLTVTKSVLPAGPQTPGTVLTYTVVIDNGGSGAASNVVMTDPVPANTTFVPGSITWNAIPQTDGGGDDAGDHDVTTAGAVTVTVGGLASGASSTITFQVTIN